MDDTLLNLDDSIVMPKPATRIVSSYFHTPAEADRRLFHAVLRAGHMKTTPAYRVERRTFAGHDLLFCIAGAGNVRSGERTVSMSAGQLGWIDNSQPHAHWPSATEPWELLWLRVESPQMDQFAEVLEVRDDPVFSLHDATNARAVFERIFALLRERPLTMDASLHAAVGCLVALLFEARQPKLAPNERQEQDARLTPGLRRVLAKMRTDYRRAWRIGDFARLAGVSVPHFFRCFSAATGSSPMDWLRRERINQAKRRLSETSEAIRSVAAEVGYADPFHFSRDFSKVVGVSPRRYRQQEQAKG
jgi:AraC-like DNA-binding protein